MIEDHGELGARALDVSRRTSRARSLFVASLVTVAALTGCTRTVSCADEPGHSFCDDDGRMDAGPTVDASEADASDRDGEAPADGSADATSETVCDGGCDAAHCVDGECVACIGAADCPSEAPLCHPETHACVACVDASDCTGAATPICDDDGTCRGCVPGPECAARDASTPACAASGACVECVDEDDCAGDVCHPVEQTCTDVLARTLDVCQPCTFDAECLDGRLCVETSFPDPTERVVGSFCLWERAAPLPGPNGTCGLSSRPFAGVLVTESVDGAPADVCTLRSTTCPAYLQHAADVAGCTVPFTDDDACGAADFNDGRCRTGAETLCTYPCGGSDDRDCPPGFACLSGADRYCAI